MWCSFVQLYCSRRSRMGEGGGARSSSHPCSPACRPRPLGLGGGVVLRDTPGTPGTSPHPPTPPPPPANTRTHSHEQINTAPDCTAVQPLPSVGRARGRPAALLPALWATAAPTSGAAATTCGPPGASPGEKGCARAAVRAGGLSSANSARAGSAGGSACGVAAPGRVPGAHPPPGRCEGTSSGQSRGAGPLRPLPPGRATPGSAPQAPPPASPRGPYPTHIRSLWSRSRTSSSRWFTSDTSSSRSSCSRCCCAAVFSQSGNRGG